MFKLAEESLKDNPVLKKVIILKSISRYDPVSADPCSIKAKLNQFGNTMYDSMWMEKGCPTNISIEDQHLDCHGPLREKRFGNPASVGYDGKPWDGWLFHIIQIALFAFCPALSRLCLIHTDLIITEPFPRLSTSPATCTTTKVPTDIGITTDTVSLVTPVGTVNSRVMIKRGIMSGFPMDSTVWETD